MTSTRFPGSVGFGMGLEVDKGTTSRVAGSSPGYSCADRLFVICVGQKISVYTAEGLEQLGEVAYKVIMEKLESIKDDIDECLKIISALPRAMQQRVAYEFFASFFDHYLPKKFLARYVWGQGKELTLSEQEMIDCNPIVNLQRSREFNKLVQRGKKNPSEKQPFQLNIWAGARTNGTLGQFTVRIKGELVVKSNGEWEVNGLMSFYDEWDFDPKDFKTGGRSFQGEVKTRAAHYLLPGKGFIINSVETNFKQTQRDSNVVWVGGEPESVPDRVAGSDMKFREEIR